jgi:hypothetical protein
MVQKPTPSKAWTVTESSAPGIDSSDSNVQCTEKPLYLSGKRPDAPLHGNFSCTNRIFLVDQNLYYQGDTLEIWVDLPDSLRTIIFNEGAEPVILVMPPEGEAIVIPIEINATDTRYQLIELHDLDTSSFEPGSYQLALVLIESNSNPNHVDTWYSGFNGFIDTARVKIVPGYDNDEEDTDGDRFIDGDFNQDGFCEILSSFHLRHGKRFFWHKPACQKNLIVPHQKRYVYYQGDTLQLSLKFPHSLKAVIEGEAEAYVLIVPPEGDIIIMPVSVDDVEGLTPFFELANLDTSTLALGEYQIGLVLSKIGHNDPLNVNNWYRGLHGFISKISIKLSPGCDREDLDGDGQLDGDTDGDGFKNEPTQAIPEPEASRTEYVIEAFPNNFPVNLLEQVGKQTVTTAPSEIEVNPVEEVEPTLTITQPPVVEPEPTSTVTQPIAVEPEPIPPVNPQPVNENELVEPVVSEPFASNENQPTESPVGTESLPEPGAREELSTEQPETAEPTLVEEPEEEFEDDEFFEFFDDVEFEDSEEDVEEDVEEDDDESEEDDKLFEPEDEAEDDEDEADD